MPEIEMPWGPSPESVYESYGPKEPLTFELRGHKLEVTPLDMAATDTFRMLYAVRCITCGKKIHEATTGPRLRCIHHVSEPPPPMLFFERQAAEADAQKKAFEKRHGKEKKDGN